MNKKTKKQIWRTLLAIGLLLEIALIGITIKSMLDGGNEAIDHRQIVFFCALAVWIYIAYLKQRSVDISRNVVDEKIKTHLLVNHLRDGILLLDPANRVMLINSRAAAITGLAEIHTLGQDLAASSDRAIAELLNSGRSGETTGLCRAGGKKTHVSLALLPPDREGEVYKLMYVSEFEDRAGLKTDSAPNINQPRMQLETFERICAIANELLKQASGSADAMRSALDGNLYAFRMLGIALKQYPPEAIFPDIATKSDVDMVAMANELAAPWRNAFGIRWDMPRSADPLLARLNPLCARLAVRQIITNAVAATAGTNRAIIIRLAPLGSHAGFSALDGGQKPTETDLPKFFDVPYRGLTGADENPPTSGLFAARRIVEAMGGTLTAAPGAEGGLLTTIMLPGPV